MNVDELKTLAAQVSAKQDPAALVAGCRFVRRPDPTDARFQIIELRTPSPVVTGGACEPVEAQGDDAARFIADMCIETARAAGLK